MYTVFAIFKHHVHCCKTLGAFLSKRFYMNFSRILSKVCMLGEKRTWFSLQFDKCLIFLFNLLSRYCSNKCLHSSFLSLYSQSETRHGFNPRSSHNIIPLGKLFVFLRSAAIILFTKPDAKTSKRTPLGFFRQVDLTEKAE